MSKVTKVSLTFFLKIKDNMQSYIYDVLPLLLEVLLRIPRTLETVLLVRSDQITTFLVFIIIINLVFVILIVYIINFIEDKFYEKIENRKIKNELHVCL